MNGTRLKFARKKAGYSLRSLADALDRKVSAQSIGKYERGEMIPSSDVLTALSKTLGVTIAYLMDTSEIELKSVDFRRKANTTAKDRARVEIDVLEWVERYLQIEQILGINSAEWEQPLRKLEVIYSLEDAEILAQKVRECWQLGLDPIPNMTELLEEKGLKVLVTDLGKSVSGLTCLVKSAENFPELPVIVVNKNHSLERRRLTLAHELCHRLIDDDHLCAKDKKKLANRFAGSFLIPCSHLTKGVRKHRHLLGYQELMSLKRIYRVSGVALLVRLRDIEVISDAVLTYLFQSVAQTWRTNEPEELEPVEKRGKYETPRRLERLCYHALAEGLISVSKAADLLNSSIKQVEIGLKGPK